MILLKENIGENICHLGLGKQSLGITNMIIKGKK